MTRQGAVVSELYFPTTVFLANTLRLDERESALVYVMGAEGVTGLGALLAEEPSPLEIEARSAGYAYRLSASALRGQIQRSPDLRILLQKRLFDYEVQTAHAVGCAAHHSTIERLATLLLRGTDRLANDKFLVTQQDLADFLGLQRTTVVSAAKQLKDAKAIRYSRGAIRIMDRGRLEAAACGCHARPEIAAAA